MMNTTCLEKAGVGRDFVFDNERSRLDVTRMIIKHGYPLDMVEHEFFQTFVKNLQPKFKLYSQDTLKADILNVYKKEKEKLYKYFGTLSCHFNLIIQFWTCHTKKNMYCCLALQFLEDGLILKKKILALKKVVQYNDIVAETLFGTVTSLLREWNIDKKLCSITLESSYSNNVIVQEFESRIHHRTCRLPLCGHLFHIHCITSIINRLLQDGLNEIGGVLCKIRSTIRYINEASVLWKMNYQSTLKQHNLQDKYSTICEDVSTRGDSSFLMLESALELRKVFSLSKGNDRDFVAMNPSVEEWDMAVVVYKYLKVLYDAICSFSGSKCLTANVYFPKVCSIHLKLLELQKSEHTYIHMVVRMKEKFDKYFHECITVLAIAVILDPRKKFDFVQFAFEHLNGCHEAGNILADICNTLNDIFDDYAKELGMQASSSSSVNNHNSNSFPSHFDHDNCNMLDMWYKSKHRNSVACLRAELDRYLGGEIIDNADRDFDILGWWGANSLDFPIVGQMALDILGIPMSTCAISDSDFNAESMTMINPVFDGLDPEIIEA
ncbi:hypothetical protein CIPAW_01G174400 [Carya illinoinensis]|uniref:Uncharacterized protein n=1 Tax=Carya illinoinensis TaxID=32201 RepID=A0A8T1RQG3_CARIL|nr:hypothetical protein CIPAW_01G174400 [Carya illinoinensis]